MAAEDTKMAVRESVTVIHGNLKYDIMMGDADEMAGKKIKDLSEAVYNASGIPVHKQKLIYRGKTLSKENPETLLSAAQVTPKSKIMLIGKRINEDEQKTLQSINKYRLQSDDLVVKLGSLKKEILGIEQGYLPAGQLQEALEKLTKRVKINSESFMCIIEALDRMELGSDFIEARAKRKSLITQINGHLSECDTTEERLNTLISKL